MAALLATLPAVPRRSRHEAPDGAGGSLSTLWRIKEVRILTAMSFVFFAAYGPLEPALPLYARTTLAEGATSYGLLWSAYGVGALLGLLLIPRISGFTRPGVVFATIAVLWGVLLAPLVVVTRLLPAMACLAIAGCAWAPYVTIETSLLQRLTPAALHGRVFGARSAIITGSVPLGVFAGGLLLDRISAPAVIGISAVACVVTGGAGLLSPTLRAIRRQERAGGRTTR
jgi:predicted MFS family arabinose efflux permease